MKYFAQMTSGGPQPAENEAESGSTKPNAVIMGRKTWDGIPLKFRPLKDRQNLIISRSNSVDISNSISASSPTSLHPSLPSALSSLSPSTTNRVFLIGGAQIYRQALLTTPPLISRILLTRIKSPAFECDAFLEEFRELETDDGRKLWRKASGEELKQWAGWNVEVGEIVEKEVTYEFEMWVLNA
ncbi:dihydrofolate reductase [Phaffia rhodozyma]|uniref:Dihydrofolate reductase n=1 Tax=Phaffia rhodozyma TaxID=264483 RepID=A0A0F7SGG4_PHARH|nr:dihydrofolate reductase [Phaffia rhodozyma]